VRSDFDFVKFENPKTFIEYRVGGPFRHTGEQRRKAEIKTAVKVIAFDMCILGIHFSERLTLPGQ
jgi:hypothetical protein